ncbi:MAG: beta strand repeat-containing protein [Gemmataceae bacterium]
MGFRKYTREIREYLKTRRNRRSAKKQTKRLQLETLEDRTVPTVVFVPQQAILAHQLPSESVGDSGGPVLSNVPIQLILNGNGWGTKSAPSAAAVQVENALTGLINTAYFSGINEYRGLPGHITYDPVNSTAWDPNKLSNGFSFFDPKLLLPPPTLGLGDPIDFTGSLDGNINSIIDSGLLPEPSSPTPLYVLVTSPDINPTGNVAGLHTWFPDLDTWIPNISIIPIPPTVPSIGSHVDFTAWVGTQANADGTLNMDGFTSTLSHELVESITDPGAGFSLPGGSITNGILNAITIPTSAIVGTGGLLTGGSSQEIADGEPEGKNGPLFGNPYNYHLPDPTGASNGINVQAFWSQRHGAFIVSDGNSENFFLTPQYDAANNFLNTYALRIQGDQIPGSPGDNIVINQTSDHRLIVNENGQVATFDNNITSIEVDSGSGNDNITVAGLPADMPMTVNLGGGSDTVNFGGLNQNIDGVLSNVTVNGGGGADTLQVNDSANSHVHTYTMEADSIRREVGSVIHFNGMRTVYLDGGTGSNDYEIHNTPANAATNINLARSAANLVNLEADAGMVDIYSASSDTAANSDGISIGAGNLDSITGLVTVHGLSTSTHVSLDDHSESHSNRTDTAITSTGVTRVFDDGSRNPFAGVNYSGLAGLTYSGGAGPNSVNVQSTAAGAPVTVTAGSGTDSVDVGAIDFDSSHLGNQFGSLDPVRARVTVNGNGASTTLNVDDTAVITTQTYTIDSSNVNRTNSPGIGYSALSFLNAYTGFGSDTVNIESTGASQLTSVHGGPTTTSINLAPVSRNLDRITFLEVSRARTLNVDDQGSALGNPPGSTAYSIGNSSLGRTATYLGFIGSQPIVATRSASINYRDMSNLVLNAGPRHNTISVGGTSATTTINAGPHADTITVANSLDNIGLLTPGPVNVQYGVPTQYDSHGVLTVNANGGSLTLDDSGTQNIAHDPLTNNNQVTHTSLSYTITSQSVARADQVAETLYLSSPGFPRPPIMIVPTTLNYTETINYNGASSLTIDGSSVPAGSTFTVSSTAATTPVSINGGMGNDRLVGPNAINTWLIRGLNQGSVGNVAFAGIENLTGGSGLTGQTGADTFQFYTGGQITGLVDGGGGIANNTLDYEYYPTGVSVNLLTGAASAVHNGAAIGVQRIQNLIGTRYNDTLIGDNNANVIQSPGGRDVMMGNGGDDTFRIWGAQDPGTTIDGGAGTDVMWVADFPNTWNITGAGNGTVLGTIPGYQSGFSFSNMENLLGGLNTDTFVMADGATLNYVNGNSGVNTLDYSAWTTPVTVSLSSHGSYGSAMNVHDIVTNFQNVIGSRTAVNTLTGSNVATSILVGGANNDVITAGTQQAILIGGLGADVLTGGAADDLLIAGATSYDANMSALQSIMAEWHSGHSYADRIDLIRGVTSNPLYSSRLNGSNFFNASTVFGDSATDQLTGGLGMDWFWVAMGQDSTDRNGTEVLN